MVHDGALFIHSTRKPIMQNTPSRKARHSTKPEAENAAAARPKPTASASSARQTRRKSLAAFIMAIPPGDPSDERDFARIQ